MLTFPRGPETSARPQTPVPASSASALVRLPFLDGIRGLAALSVVFYHAWQCCFIRTRQESLPAWFHMTHVLKSGHFAVGVFIVLSGYCLMLPVARDGAFRGGILDFLRRRARRILPPYYAALAFSLALVWLVPSSRYVIGGEFDVPPPDVLAGSLISHLLLFHNLSASWAYRFDAPLWSVATEWQIYFAFPFVLLPLWWRAGTLVTVLVGFAAGWCAAFLGAWSASFWYLGLFGLGMGAAAVGFSPKTPEKLRRLPWGVIATGAALVALVFITMHGAGLQPFQDLAVGIATSCLMIQCASSVLLERRGGRAWPRRLLSHPVATGLGSFSYSVYLIHYPLIIIAQVWLARIDLEASTDFLVLSLCVPIIVGISYLFHLAFERPFLGRSTPKIERQAEQAATVSPAP